MSNDLGRPSQLSPLKQAYLALEKMQARLEAFEQARREPIAIIGAGCRFPGQANTPETFWQLLSSGVDAITEVPAERWDINTYYDPDPDVPAKMSTRWGGFLKQVDEFDPQFFGIAPREAVSMDPQQRLLLEVAWEALEHAGQAPDKLGGSRTGVFVGLINNDYRHLKLETTGLTEIDAYYSSGIAMSMAAGRLSYVLGLQGPSLTVDTACSSSLVAVHLACQSLRSGECQLALACGANLILAPELFIAFSKYRMLAPDGRCKTFDARADGFSRGEGCGVIVLKRLSAALADGDNILALILGTAINQDGASSGLTAPNGPAQEAVIREALANAGLKPAEVSYVEAHGTGTSLGDPIEVQALAAVLGQGREPDKPLAIGSVKTNVGHLEGAAGIAGLLKAALALQHRQIPPHLHLQEPNPLVPWADLPLVIPTELTPWPSTAPLVAGVSAFGFSGTNVHVILGAAPALEPVTAETERPRHLLTLSARNEAALKELAARFEAYLPTGASETALADICYTANTGRAHLNHRLAISAVSGTELGEKLAAFSSQEQPGKLPAGVIGGPVQTIDQPKIAFLFTGQGSQYPGMGQQLYETQPTFRQTIDRCAEVLQPYLPQPLLSVLYPENGQSSPINETTYTQPALFAVEYALAELWRSWGVHPTAVMGHSIGEYVAACLAGVFSLEDALKLIAERSRLMGTLPPGGRMVAILADESRVAEAIRPYADQVAIAAINGPENVVISGASAAIQAIINYLAAEGVKARPLTVSHAFHSPLMEPMLSAFEKVATEVTYTSPRIKLVSNVTGKLAMGNTITTANYWQHHARQPVQFAAAMETLGAQGIELFLEIGPHPTLLGMGQRCLPDTEAVYTWLPSLRRGRDDWQQMLQSLGEMYVYGLEVNWTGFDRDYAPARRRLRLPTSPFSRKRYWLPAKSRRSVSALTPGTVVHPLLGQRVRSALKTMQFESQIRADSLPFLNDHRIFGRAIMPGTAYLETGLAAAEAFGIKEADLTDVVIYEPLVAEEAAWRTMQVLVTPEGNDSATFEVFSQEENGASPDPVWSRHASGTIKRRPGAKLIPEPALPAAIQARCTEEVVATAHYTSLQERGLDFGPGLHGLDQAWRLPQGGEALGRVCLPEALTSEMGAYHIHPALLDACLQVLAAALPDHARSELYMPVGLDSLQLYDRVDSPIWSHVRLEMAPGKEPKETYVATVRLLNETGHVVAELVGLHLKRATEAGLAQLVQPDWKDWLYQIEWQAKPVPAPEAITGLSNYLPSPVELVAHAQPLMSGLHQQYRLDQSQELAVPFNKLGGQYVLYALQQLGWMPELGQSFATEALAQALNVLERYHPLLGRLLEILQEDGWLQRLDANWLVCQVPDQLDFEALLAQEKSLLSQYPAFEAELTLVGRCGPQLGAVLTGSVDPLQLLFPGGDFTMAEKLYQASPLAHAYNGLVQTVIESALARLPEGRTIRVLEIGGGTGGTTSYILPQFPPDQTEYVFTDISPAFTAKAAIKFANFPFVKYQPLDIERNPAGQGIEAHQFDLILAANIIHATADLRQTLQHVQHLLAPGGLFLMLEVVRPERWIDLTFGLTEGWWKFSDTEIRPTYPLLDRKAWKQLLRDAGFATVALVPESPDSGLVDQALILSGDMPGRNLSRQQENWLIFADETGVGQGLAELIRSQGGRCVLVSPGTVFGTDSPEHFCLDPTRPDDFRRLLRESIIIKQSTWDGIIHLWGLTDPPSEAPDSTSLSAAHSLGCGSVLYLVQALATLEEIELPPLWLVTRGTQPVSTDIDSGLLSVAQSSIWGLARTIALEHPDLHCRRIDLGSVSGSEDAQRLLAEIRANDREDQVALRQNGRYVARLTRYRPRQDGQVSTEQPVRLELTTRGLLDNLAFQPATRRPPGPGEVEIRVYATGLNFKDVLNALGMYPGDAGPLGSECTGVIVNIGPDVTGLEVDEAVMAVAPGSFSTFVTTSVNLVVRKPDHLSYVEAATMLIPFLTAYYTLHHLGRMSAGERVLIHAAAGGVGLAAVQLAQRAGAEVFGTAGSPEKRAFLKSLGVSHVLDSRSLDFADEIMEITQGKGVDVVLNSLADEFVPKTLSVLASQGRFLEIGKRGILAEEEVKRLRPDASYWVVDWGETNRQEPALMRSLLLELMADIEAGTLTPLPQRVFSTRETVSAFRYMAQARHIGKIVITWEDKIERQSSPLTIHPEATYLITGGLGGLGLKVARWLVDKGARYLALVGRSRPGDSADQVIQDIEQRGAKVVVFQSDISAAEQVAAVLTDIEASLPPLKGVIQAAGVLDDGVLLHQDWSRFAKVLAPKADGTWHLHTLTQHRSLDFFVLFSSIASLFGSPGQGNHAAANAFMDTVAHYRRAQGLPALSINWGAWSEIGAVVEHQTTGRLTEQGLGLISPEEGLQIFEYLLGQPTAQVGVTPVNWATFLRYSKARSDSPFLVELGQEWRVRTTAIEPASPAPNLVARLKDAPAHKRRNLLLNFVQEQAARVLGLDSSQGVGERVPLSELGLDSLMAVELRNLLSAGLSLKRILPATLVFDYPTVEAISNYLVKELDLLPANDQGGSTPSHDSEVALMANNQGTLKALEAIEELSDEEVDRLFNQQVQQLPNGANDNE